MKPLVIDAAAASRLAEPPDRANDATTASNGHTIVVRAIRGRVETKAHTCPASAAPIIAEGAAITEK